MGDIVNSLYLFFGLFGVLCLLLGIVINRLIDFISDIFLANVRKKTLPFLEEAKVDLLCTGPHSYDSIKLAMAPLPVEDYRICVNCGFVSESSGRFKLNKPALELYRAELVKRTELERKRVEIAKLREDMLSSLFQSLIISGVGNFTEDRERNAKELEKLFKKLVEEVDSLYSELVRKIDPPNG